MQNHRPTTLHLGSVGHNFKRFWIEKTPEKRRLLTTAGAEVVGNDAGVMQNG